MTGVEIAVVIIFILFLATIIFVLGLMLVIGKLSSDLEAFKAGVRGMAGAADKAFIEDRTMIHEVVKFLVAVHGLHEITGTGKQASTDLQTQVSPKKSGEFKN